MKNKNTKYSHPTLKAMGTRGFSHHFLLPLLAVLAVGAIGYYLLRYSSAATQVNKVAGPATTEQFVAQLRGDIQGRRFVGDGGASVRTSNGYTLSFFGDTVVYKSDTVYPQYPEANNQTTYMMRNNVLITSPGNKVKSGLSGQQLLDQKSFVDVPERLKLPNGKNYYWPNAVATDFSSAGKGRTVYVFLGQMYSPDANTGNFNFEYAGSRLAKYYVSDTGSLKLTGNYILPTYLKDTKPIAWGSGLLLRGDWAYIYGSNKPVGEWIWGFDHYLARVKIANIGSPKAWRYWDGSMWQTNQSLAQPVVPNAQGAEGAITISRDASTGLYTFVYKKFGFIGKEVYRATASAPQGPWTFPDASIGTPAVFNDKDFTYCGYEIPLAGGRKGVIVSHGNSEPVPFEQQGIHSLL